MEALFYEKLDDNKVKCNLCNHRCIINDGKRGICNVRENKTQTLESLVYGKLIASNVDPIEKKPIYHLMPASSSYSISTVGCNFKCRFCQNSDIAQMPSDNNGLIMGDFVEPEKIVNQAIKNNCDSISYTYTEPTIYFEYAYEIAKLAKAKGLKNILVTNGYITKEALEFIAPYIDAANVDLKAFNDNFYKKYCGAKLQPVLETLKLMKSLGIFIEITTLIIPELNDDKDELENLTKFIADDLGNDVPWHISRFHPTYKLTNFPATPAETLISARKIGIKNGLRYVYIGNIATQDGSNTYCYNCGEIVVNRMGYSTQNNIGKNNKCKNCEAVIDGVEMSGI